MEEIILFELAIGEPEEFKKYSLLAESISNLDIHIVLRIGLAIALESAKLLISCLCCKSAAKANKGLINRKNRNFT
jgi:hypothetical protein